jgi:D-alanyl-D-alanine carboxypeptidase
MSISTKGDGTMHRTPPHEEENSDQPEPLHPPLRHKPVARRQRPIEYYHSDDHPEVPKIRRASLRLDDVALPDSKPPQREVRPASIAKMAPRKKGGEAVQGQDTLDDQSAAPKIVVAKRSRPPVYEPPTPARYSSRGRSWRQGSVLSVLQAIGNNQTAIFVITLVLVAAIVLSIVFSALMNNLHHPANSVSVKAGKPTGSHATATPASTLPPPDPHELVIAPTDLDHPPPAVFAAGAYLLDADTGATLYAHNPFLHLPIMSTTKLMTAVLAAEHGNPDQQITINDAINNDINQLSADSSVMGLNKGETYTLRELLYGLFLVSGNDAAVAIADAIGGNLPNFVAMMNARAQQLAMYDTHYMNPHGLLETGHYSCAHDLAIIGQFSMSIPLIRQISGALEYTIPKTAQHPEHFLVNGDQFLWWYPGVDGGKPGWDAAKNYVLLISCIRNHHHLIGVVIYSNNFWTDMRNLLNWGFDDFTWISPHDVDLQHPIVYDDQSNYFVADKPTNTIPTVDGGRYYIYTGYSVSNPILPYFDANGGLTKFGYPTGMPTMSSDTVISQQFEHGTIQCDTQAKQCQSA